MIKELDVARQNLHTALNIYAQICSEARDLPSLRNIPPDDSRRQMDEELRLLTSYELKLREAKQAISEARNYFPKVIPINSLPPEVLLRIFGLVKAANYCSMDKMTNCCSHLPVLYPDYLTHVCSHWRHVAISSPSLWTHIDFVPHDSPRRRFLDRAHVQVARSGGLPLQVHATPPIHSPISDAEAFIDDIFSPVLGRIGVLEFEARGPVVGDLRGSTFTKLLTCRAPQGLTKLVVNSKAGTNGFIMSHYSPGPLTVFPVELTEEELEDSFAHLTILHLRGAFPKWTSVAYHNLVDLRLSFDWSDFWTTFTESELRQVLNASPGLRILYLELRIIHPAGDGPITSPIPLKDLEVLHIGCNDEHGPTADVGKLLKLLGPGSRPLRLTLRCTGYNEFNSFKEIKRFFMRSNVVKFCAQTQYPPLGELPSLAPGLQCLVFRSCGYGSGTTSLMEGMDPAGEDGGTSETVRWGSWCIRSCQMNLDDLSRIVRLYQTGILVVSDCIIRRGSTLSQEGATVPEEELVTMFPSVKFAGSTKHHNLSDPTVDWDVID